MQMHKCRHRGPEPAGPIRSAQLGEHGLVTKGGGLGMSLGSPASPSSDPCKGTACFNSNKQHKVIFAGGPIQPAQVFFFFFRGF